MALMPVRTAADPNGAVAPEQRDVELLRGPDEAAIGLFDSAADVVAYLSEHCAGGDDPLANETI